MITDYEVLTKVLFTTGTVIGFSVMVVLFVWLVKQFTLITLWILFGEKGKEETKNENTKF